LDLAIDASSSVRRSRVAGLASENESIPTISSADTLRIGNKSSSSANNAGVSRSTGLAGWTAGLTTQIRIEELSIRASNRFKCQLLANTIRIHIESIGA
jgi:hypothetical protein